MRALLLGMPNTTWALNLYGNLPNLAIVSLAGNVDDEFEVSVADLVLIRKNFLKFLENQISRHSPDILGISAMSFQFKVARYITRYAKELDPNIKVVLGGYHATTITKEVDKTWYSDIDYLIRGEGETTFNEFLRSLDSNKPDLHEIGGLSYKKNGNFVHNRRRALEDLSTLKRPNRSARVLKEKFQAFGLQADVVESSRGCLNSCNFCSIKNMYGRSFRKFPISRTLDEIESCKNRGIKSITFVDDNINLDSRHFGKICDGIIDRGLNTIHYSTQINVAQLYNNPKLYKKMAEANFKLTFLGIENPNPKILQFFGKNVKKMATKGEVVVSNLRSHNIIVMGGFITGNPEDTIEDFYNVLNYAKRIKVDFAVFSPIQPYPKTRIREILSKKGLIVNKDDLSRYDGFTHNAITTHLSMKQLEALSEKMWSGFYNLDWVFWNNFRRIYPKYFLKVLVKYSPRYLKHLTYKLTGMKSSYEISQEEIQLEKEFRDLKR